MATTTRRAIAALLFSVLALLPLNAAGLAAAEAGATALAQPACGDLSGYTEVDLSALPNEAADTVDLIEAGGPFPYPQDGTVFQNREDLLPDCSTGYYHEYTVETPGLDHRGARRIVTGSDGEFFYTSDHYASFRLVDVRS
ncbi:ribonuclease domain-containing protein [Actinoalloteichus hymeniacidonis]|nr:ribonuclease domain-containing protein [Actinoalloteichus hymeniacidonis]MBB5906655.1 ribonuclease T1 [Actinoalloteichus hymeniacidonis]